MTSCLTPFLSRYRKILLFAISGHLSDMATIRQLGLINGYAVWQDLDPEPVHGEFANWPEYGGL